MNIVIPEPFDQKSRNRLNEHGNLWEAQSEAKTVSFSTQKHILLRSVKTGYEKWWPEDRVSLNQREP